MTTTHAAAGGGSATKTITTQFRGSVLASDSKMPVLVVTKKATSQVNISKSSDEDIQTARRKGDNECARDLIDMVKKKHDDPLKSKAGFFKEFGKNNLPDLILTITGDAKKPEFGSTRCVQQFALHGAIYYLLNGKRRLKPENPDGNDEPLSSWIVTGGTCDGIMGACGKCFRDLRKRRNEPSSECSNVTLLGIARSGPEDLETPLNMSQADADVVLKSPRKYDPHHDFLILYDNGEPLVHGRQERPWGTEVQFRRAFELYTARKTDPGASVVCMVFGGGKNTFATILSCCRDKIPVLLIKDSGKGKAADLLIEARTILQNHPDPGDPYVFEWYRQRQETLIRPVLGDMCTFERFIACCTSPLVDVFYPNFLVFARKEFFRRSITIDPKEGHSDNPEKVVYVEDLFKAGKKILDIGTQDSGKFSNVEEAFHRVLFETSRASSSGQAPFFEAELNFLKQILSDDQPGEEFKDFVSFLASTATSNNIVTDYGMMTKMHEMRSKVGDFWNYSSSWMPKRSLSSTRAAVEQYQCFLDASWFGNIASGVGKKSSDGTIIPDQPFIANLSTEFSPMLFKMHAEKKWKLPSPSILISINGKLISEASKDEVKQFLRVDLFGFVNSLVSFNQSSLPWIFCEGHGELAGLISDSSLSSSNRVSAGKSIPVIGFSSAASLCTIKPVRYSSHPWEIHLSNVWKYWADPESAGIEQPFRRISQSQLICEPYGRDLGCGGPFKSQVSQADPSKRMVEEIDCCFGEVSSDGVIVGTYHRKCLPVDSKATFRAFDDVLLTLHFFNTPAFLTLSAVVTSYRRFDSPSILAWTYTSGKCIASISGRAIFSSKACLAQVESSIMQECDTGRLSFLIGGDPCILPSLLQKLSDRSHLIVLSDSGGVAGCIADCFASMRVPSREGPFKYTIEIKKDPVIEVQAIEFVLEGDSGTLLISKKFNEEKNSSEYSQNSRFHLGDTLLRCVVLGSEQQVSPEVVRVKDHFSCRSYEPDQTGNLNLKELKLFFRVYVSVTKKFKTDELVDVDLSFKRGSKIFKSCQSIFGILKSESQMKNPGFTIFPQKSHPCAFVLEFEYDDESPFMFEDLKQHGFSVECISHGAEDSRQQNVSVDCSNNHYVNVDEICIHIGRFEDLRADKELARHNPSKDNMSFLKFLCDPPPITGESRAEHRMTFSLSDTSAEFKVSGARALEDFSSREMILKLASSEFVHVFKPKESSLRHMMDNIQKRFSFFNSDMEKNVARPLSIIDSKSPFTGYVGRHGLLGFAQQQTQSSLASRPFACIIEDERCNIEPVVSLLLHHGKPYNGSIPWEANFEIAPNIVFSFAESHIQKGGQALIGNLPLENTLKTVLGSLLDSIPSFVGAWMLNSCASTLISETLSNFVRQLKFEATAAERSRKLIDARTKDKKSKNRTLARNATAADRSRKLDSCGFFGLGNLENTLGGLAKDSQNKDWYDVFEESIFQVPLNNNNLFFGIQTQQGLESHLKDPLRIPYLPISKSTDDNVPILATPLDAVIFVAHSEKVDSNVDYRAPDVFGVSPFKSGLLSYLRDCFQACHVCVAFYVPAVLPKQKAGDAHAEALIKDIKEAHDKALIDEVLFASQLNSGIVVVRSKDGQKAQAIVGSRAKSDNTFQASYELNKLNLNIFDILALVFENPAVKYKELLSPLPPTWSKIEEICRNVSTKNSHQCLLKVIDYVEEKQKLLKEEKEKDCKEEENIFGKNMQRVVSRLVVLQSVCHNRVKFNMVDDQKETSLMLAVCMGPEKELLVQSLLEMSSLESILQPSENPIRFGQDAFLMALVANNRNMAKLILEHLLQLAKKGSLLFHDFGQMLCRVYFYIPALFLLIRMGTSSESMLDLILEISQICKVRHSSSVDDSDDHTQSKLSTPGERGLMHILSSLTDGFGCSALHHAIRSNCPPCVKWVMKILQLDGSYDSLNMDGELLSITGSSFQKFKWNFWSVSNNTDDTLKGKEEIDFLGSLLNTSHVKNYWYEDLHTNSDTKTFDLKEKSMSKLSQDVLTMQNEISQKATLLYHIFAGISPKHHGPSLLSRNEIFRAYHLLYKFIETDVNLSFINSRDVGVGGRLAEDIFVDVFEVFGHNSHPGDLINWRLVLEKLACGIRRSHCMKSAPLTEYELSSILLHYWEKLRYVEPGAEERFQKQKQISRALIPDTSDQSHSGSVQHEYLKFSSERSLLLRKRISWPIMFSLAFIVILTLAACIFVTSPLFDDSFRNVVQSLSGMQHFLSIKDLPDFQLWALQTFSPTLFELSGGTSLYSPISRWGSVRLRQLRVKPEPCKGFSTPWSSQCVPLQYNDAPKTAPFSFNYAVGGTLQSKSVPFSAGSRSDFNLLDFPKGGYDIFFGSSEPDQKLWNALFSPNSTYVDAYTSAIFIVGTFYEPSVQKYVVVHFGLQFEPSKSILSAALLSDFFWDQSRQSGQSLTIDLLCALMLGYFSWISFNCILDIRGVLLRKFKKSNRDSGSLESLGHMKMISARSTVFQAFFTSMFWVTAAIVFLFVLESRDSFSKIPQDHEFVDLLGVSRYIYFMKNLLCFFVITSYVHFLSLMREVPAIGGPVSAILYTIVDMKLLIFVILLFIFNTAISTAQFIGFRGDDMFLNTLQSVWFESMNSLISGASLTSVQNHQYIGPSSSSYSGSGVFFMLTVVFGNILMMNLVIGVLSERYEDALRRYGTEAWNDDMSCRLGSYVLNSKLFLPSLRSHKEITRDDGVDASEFPNVDRFLQFCYCSNLVSSRTGFLKYLCCSFFLYPVYIIIEVACVFRLPFELVHEPFPKLHSALKKGKPRG